MFVGTMVKDIIVERGLYQKWVVEKMNYFNPTLGMTCSKLSSIVCGSRKMSADELLAFCKATQTSPDCFLQMSLLRDGVESNPIHPAS